MQSLSYFLISFCLLNSVSQTESQTLVAQLSSVRLPFVLDSTSTIYDGDDSIIILGGSISSSYSNYIMRYSVSQETIRHVAKLPKHLTIGATAADGLGNVYYFGGFSSEHGYSSSIYKFSTITNEVVEVGDLPRSNADHVAFLLNEAFFIFAGTRDRTGVVRMDLGQFNPQRVGGLPTGYDMTTGFSNGEDAFIIGPRPLKKPAQETLQPMTRYSPGENVSQILYAEMPEFYDYPAAVWGREYGYVIGGFEPTNEIIQINVLTNETKGFQVAGFPGYEDIMFSRTSAVYVERLDRIYFFGGISANISDFWGFEEHDEIWFIDLSPLGTR